jgi:2-polyprenyl-3-methyl-5-hydroxy-6-metoxy-1,4-benzoquinol methylase
MPDAPQPDADALAARLISSTAAFFDVYAVYLGDRLGFYRSLADDGPATSAVLARRCNCHERYVREWLEQQAVTGILTAASDGADGRTFSLPPEHARVLADMDDANFLAPLTRAAVGAASATQPIINAYREGHGVPFADYGEDMRMGQAYMNRVAFLESLPTEWLPAIPEVDARLKADPPARVADIGCGAAWSCIGIARAYPKVRVDGYDLDLASVELAARNILHAGLSDRVSVHLRDAGDPELAGQYDLVTILEALHDMGRPVEALRAARRILAPGGNVLVADENVAHEFTAPGDEVERMMYGWSILHCLPAGIADAPSVATGTVLRPAALRDMARDAGFANVEILPIENVFFRFYRLT